MKKIDTISLLMIACFVSHIAFSQSRAGITEKPDTSFSLYSAYVNTAKSHPETRIVPELSSHLYSSKRDISYCEVNERKLLMDVFYPKKQTKKKRIALIIIHGGGWRSGNRTMHYAMAQKLATRGYVCFTPEYRLSTEALYPAAVYDVKAAIRWVRQNANQFNIDTSKIVVAGHSAGGELAAFIGSTNGKPGFEGNQCNLNTSSRVDAVIDIDGILAFIHPESGEGDDSKRISAATYWFGYSRAENTGIWKEASPLSHAGVNTPPTLFLNSSVDRMHAGRNDYIKILDQYKIYTEVKTFEGAPHSFVLFHPWFDPTIKQMDRFLNKVLKK